jgi:hypothetical protein
MRAALNGICQLINLDKLKCFFYPEGMRMFIEQYMPVTPSGRTAKCIIWLKASDAAGTC